jgi:FtsP/CotA-like multicopper oxidase with cupredoxin domain
VVLLPDGKPGDVLTLWTRDYERNGDGDGFARIPTVPVLHLHITDSVPEKRRYSISTRLPLRRDPGVDSPVENLRRLPRVGGLLDPAGFASPLPGTNRKKIKLTVSRTVPRRPSIDGVVGAFNESLVENFTLIPNIASSRYARVGDLLRLKVKNTTPAHHPFHLHGFSFQPLKIKQAGNTLFKYRYREFVDTVDIQPGHTLVFLVRLDDRPMTDGTSSGGALGRWVFHCHIFHHAGLGMISELVVLPALP